MRTLHYTLKDAKQWAEFSGDDNPIHFDLAWVRDNGGQQLSVHGMRALLDAKQFASEQFSHAQDSTKEAANKAFIKCAVRLRSPLWNDKNYDLVARNKAGSVAILASDEQQNCLTCQLSSVEHETVNKAEWTGCISSEEMAKLQLSFSLFPKGLYEWQFIDAVLFRYLINDNSLLKQKDISKQLPEGTTLNAIFSHYSVVQTHQEIIFDSEFLTAWSPMGVPAPIDVQILPALVIGDMDNGLLISINIIASYKNKFISNSITLKVNSANKHKG